MSIDPISSTNSNQTNVIQANFQQMSTYFNQLGQALQSGDLSGAQSVFASLQQLLPSSSANQAQTAQQTSQSTFNTDINALGQALQSGDLSKARDAFAKLQQDMQAAHKGHHHHHHHKAGNSQNSVSSANSSSSSSNNVSSGDSQSDTNINVVA
jgi:ribosomal protein S20